MEKQQVRIFIYNFYCWS